jgi:hypothetical protein
VVAVTPPEWFGRDGRVHILGGPSHRNNPESGSAPLLRGYAISPCERSLTSFRPRRSHTVTVSASDDRGPSPIVPSWVSVASGRRFRPTLFPRIEPVTDECEDPHRTGSLLRHHSRDKTRYGLSQHDRPFFGPARNALQTHACREQALGRQWRRRLAARLSLDNP